MEYPAGSRVRGEIGFSPNLKTRSSCMLDATGIDRDRDSVVHGNLVMDVLLKARFLEHISNYMPGLLMQRQG